MYHTLQMPTEQSDALTNTPYLTIEELSSAVKKTIEGRFEFVRVRGEVSQLRVPASGHVYFALQDEKNTLSSVIWRGSAARLSVQPEEGLDVICSGKMTTFGGQSRYQLIVSDVEIAGEGALLKQLEARRRKLADEGLFDVARKRPLPAFPKSIGVLQKRTDIASIFSPRLLLVVQNRHGQLGKIVTGQYVDGAAFDHFSCSI